MWPSRGKGTSCTKCMDCKVRCIPWTADRDREASEASKDDGEDVMPKKGHLGLSKGKWKVIEDLEEVEGVQPKRTRVEVVLRPGVDAWMADFGPILKNMGADIGSMGADVKSLAADVKSMLVEYRRFADAMEFANQLKQEELAQSAP